MVFAYRANAPSWAAPQRWGQRADFARTGARFVNVPSTKERVSDEAEDALLAAAQAGDSRAFSKLVRLHDRRVMACAMQMLGDRARAEDAAQETFLRAWRAIARFDGRSKLSTWLYRICVNVCLNHIRKRKRTQASDIDDPRTPAIEADPSQGNTSPVHALHTQELQKRLQGALDGLSPSLRSAVVLVLLQGLPHKEAGEVLGCPEGTVAWRIHEARRKLRVELADLVPETRPKRGKGTK